MGGILVKRSGPLTTVQDRGRIGYQDLGFSASGAMDQHALTLANLLLDNDPSAAVLEATLVGPTIVFEEDNCFVLTGADFKGTLNKEPLLVGKVYAAKAGDVLAFATGFPKEGARAYIGFAGGLDLPLLMGSRSTHLKGKMGGLEGRALKAGDRIGFLAPKAILPNIDKRYVKENFHDFYGGDRVNIFVVLGPQEDAFTKAGLSTFLSDFYTVTPFADRMGIRMEGKVIEHKEKADIISDGIAFGAVQVPKEGKPIVLMSDRQSMGGYTKIANVISVDLPKMAQRTVGDKVHFLPITVEKAQKMLAEEVQYFNKLPLGWR